MTPVYRTLAMVCVALIVAVATFQDRIALAIGGVGLIAGGAVILVIILGAALSLRRRNRDEKHSPQAETQRRADGDPSRPSS